MSRRLFEAHFVGPSPNHRRRIELASKAAYRRETIIEQKLSKRGVKGGVKGE